MVFINKYKVSFIPGVCFVSCFSAQRSISLFICVNWNLTEGSFILDFSVCQARRRKPEINYVKFPAVPFIGFICLKSEL